MRLKSFNKTDLVSFLGSAIFFKIILGFFILQAAWIALSAVYPMPFDEDFHFGLIKLYAEHGTPFWSAHPAGAEVYGAMTRDPSYLYHYLMSFPYQVVELFTDSQFAQIIILRFLNIGLLASSLIIWRRLLLRSGASSALVNTCLLIFTLIPVVPMLAAHINYDNLIILLVGLVLLITLDIAKELQATKRLNVSKLSLLLAMCMLSSLVKYAFLPIFAAILLYLGWQIWRRYRQPRQLGRAFGFGLSLIDRRRRWLILASLVLVLGLFLERYGVNLVRYQTPVADCNQVLTVEQCNRYGPWQRDHFLETHKQSTPSANPLAYADDWLDGMRSRLFFTLAGPTNQHQTRGPLTLPFWAATAFGVAGFLLLVVYGRRLLGAASNRTVLGLFLTVCLVYILVLFFNGFKLYRQTAVPVAINGRYLLPILPLLFVMTGLAWRQLLNKRDNLKLALTGVAVFCLLCGGGTLTFILRSYDHWYWDNQVVRELNGNLKRTIGPVVPGYDKPTQYLP